MSDVNVTGTPLAIFFGIEGANGPVTLVVGKSAIDSAGNVELPLTMFAQKFGFTLSPDIQTQLATPLGQLFDKLWSGTPDATSGMTNRDNAAAQVPGLITAAESSAHDVTSIFPKTGTLLASTAITTPAPIPGTRAPSSITLLMLRYQLPGVQVSFQITRKAVGALEDAVGGAAAGGAVAGPLGAFVGGGVGAIYGAVKGVTSNWSLTFDGELVVTCWIPTTPPYSLFKPPTVDFLCHNATVSPVGVEADFEDVALTILEAIPNLLTGKSLNIFQSSEDQINATDTPQPVTLDFIDELTGTLTAAGLNQGFRRLAVSANAATSQLEFHLTHPRPDPPIVQNNADASGVITFPDLATGKHEIHAGDQLKVIGSGFSPAKSTNAYLSWSIPESFIDWTGHLMPSGITNSTVQWQPAGAMAFKSDSVSVQSGDTYVVPDLLPSTQYSIQVRLDDELSFGSWSAPLTITTLGSDQLQLFVNTIPPVTDSVPVGANGNFSSQVTVGNKTPKGTYSVKASIAEASFDVFAPHMALPPKLYAGQDSILEGQDESFQGEGFKTGQVDVTAGDMHLGTKMINDSDNGEFSLIVSPWLLGPGKWDVVATQTMSDGTAISASVTVTTEKFES